MAELALAIIPLIVCTIENYSTVSKVVSRYRHFSDQADEFFGELDVQCKIFHTTVQLLLAPSVGDEQARRMMQDDNDAMWTDSDLDIYMTERFSGSNAPTVRNYLDLIQRQIAKLLEVGKSFGVVTEAVGRGENLSPKKLLRRAGKKINVACSEHRIDVLLKILRARTKDFRVLVKQTERLAERSNPKEPSGIIKARVRRFVAVKASANNLYSAVGQACTKHSEHQGYIGLQPMHNDSGRVDFVLAFKSLTIQPMTASPVSAATDVFWFSIASKPPEEIRSQSSGSHNILATLNRTAKRALDRSPSPSSSVGQCQTAERKRQRKIVSFYCTPAVARPLSVYPGLVTESLPEALVNLCKHHNFCNQVQRVFNQPNLPPNRCIGYLKSLDSSQYLVYIHSKMVSTSVSKKTEMMPLSKMLSKSPTSNQLTGIGSLRKRLRVAQQLGLALLQFYQTSWLRESWSSEDILISNSVSEKQEHLSLQDGFADESYANVSIREECAVVPRPKALPLPYIRNRPLFNLGKILLELALLRRFHQLDKPDTLEDGLDADSRDYFIAQNSLENVSENMGTRFSEVVRKCLECDFGEGFDLNAERLQSSFYQHVVIELNTCEKLAGALDSK